MKIKHAKAVLLSGLILAAPFAVAHDGATGVVKKRMDAMGKIAAHLKSVNAMLRGTAELDTEAVQAAIDEIGMIARHMPDMFPEGSDAAPSEAGPKIWTDKADFDAKFADLANAATAMSEAAASGDNSAMGQAFGGLAKTCKGCHADYRINRD